MQGQALTIRFRERTGQIGLQRFTCIEFDLEIDARYVPPIWDENVDRERFAGGNSRLLQKTTQPFPERWQANRAARYNALRCGITLCAASPLATAVSVLCAPSRFQFSLSFIRSQTRS